MECRSKLSTFEVAIRNLIQVPKLNCVLTCLEGFFLIDFATHTLRKIEKQVQLFPLRCFAIPPQTRTFPCEAIHPGVDLPSLPNQILFEKISYRDLCRLVRSWRVLYYSWWWKCEASVSNWFGLMPNLMVKRCTKIYSISWNLSEHVGCWKRSRLEMQNCLFKVLGNNAVSARVVEKWELQTPTNWKGHCPQKWQHRHTFRRKIGWRVWRTEAYTRELWVPLVPVELISFGFLSFLLGSEGGHANQSHADSSWLKTSKSIWTTCPAKLMEWDTVNDCFCLDIWSPHLPHRWYQPPLQIKTLGQNKQIWSPSHDFNIWEWIYVLFTDLCGSWSVSMVSIRRIFVKSMVIIECSLWRWMKIAWKTLSTYLPPREESAL